MDPMTDEELIELGNTTLHGNLPAATVRRLFFGAMRLKYERDQLATAARKVLEENGHMANANTRAVKIAALEGLAELALPKVLGMKVVSSMALPDGEVRLYGADGRYVTVRTWEVR